MKTIIPNPELSPAVRNAMRRFTQALEIRSLKQQLTQKNVASVARANGLSVQICVELYDALKELTEISGEATIMLGSVKAVRKMSRFVAARKRALKVLAETERETA